MTDPTDKVVDTLEGDLINVTDFDNTEIKIRLENPTTHTSIKDHTKLSVIEWLDRGLVLTAPARTCAQGHSLILDIAVTKAMTNIMTFKTTAKVTATENLPDLTDRITVSFVQFEEAEWSELKDIFASRQDDIMKFFKDVRGY